MKLIERIITCSTSSDARNILIDFDTLKSVIEAHDREGLMVSVEAIEPDHRIPLTVALIGRGTPLDEIPEKVDVMLSEMGFTGWLDPVDHTKTSRKEELISEIIHQMDTKDCFDDMELYAESELISILRDVLKLDKLDEFGLTRKSRKLEDEGFKNLAELHKDQDYSDMANHMSKRFRGDKYWTEAFSANHMTQLTQAAAMKFAELKADQYMNSGEIAMFQMLQEKLCMPISTFKAALSETIGRPIHTHELVTQRKLIFDELFGKERSYPSFEYMMAKFGSDVRGQIMEAQNA